jgi:hypothetical protein
MFGKRSMFIITAVVITLAGVSAIHAQNVPLPRLPNNYQETIELFPSNLQSGFYGMYVVLCTAVSEESALRSMQSYYLTYLLKENYIKKGKGSEVINGQTFSEIYIQQRTTLLANLGNLVPAMAFYGNPGGTNWDVWLQLLMEWM